MRWVAYSMKVYHAAYDDGEPLCGAPEAQSMGGHFKEVDEVRRRRMSRVHAYMCRRCQRLTAERPAWPAWDEALPDQ